MFRNVRMHRMNKAEIIYDLADLGENIADPFPALAILLKAKVGGGESALGVAEGLAIYELGPLASILCEGRLVVERIDLRWAARHKELNDVLGPWCKVGSFRSERTWLRHRGGGSSSPTQSGLLKDPRETKSAEPRSHLPESLAPGELAIVQGGEGLAVSGFVFLEFH